MPVAFAFANPNRSCDAWKHEVWITNCCQRDEDGAVRKGWAQLFEHAQRKASFANSAWPQEGQEGDSGPVEEGGNLGDLAFAPDHWGTQLRQPLLRNNQ